MEEESPEREERKWRITGKDFSQEMKKVGCIAAPMVAVAVFQYLLQVASVMMVGHLGQLSLSSVAIATSLTNVTGFSLLSGLVGGLETLCGQAYGAQQYHKLSVYTYSAIISLFLVTMPISVLWIFMDKLLVLVGQEPSIAIEAKKYSLWLIPALLGGAIQKPLVRYLQTQSLTRPLLLSSLAALCFHVPVCWAMIFKLGLGNKGAAIAFSLANWLYIVILVVYVRYSSSCEKTRAVPSMDSFRVIGQFFRLAVPSAVMVCLKWWSLELLILLSGLLPNPKLETSVLSICLTISTLHFTVSYGFGAAASTRVSNELGAGNPHKARLAACTVTFVAAVETFTVSAALFLCRHFVGRAYSSEKQVVDYIAAMGLLLCISIVTDTFQAVISGIARGSGWQHIGAYVNLGAFYLIGIPVSLVLGFILHQRAKGFWIGIVIGSAVQAAVLSTITAFTDWQEQATTAEERISEGRESQDKFSH
ncbi:protein DETOXIFICATION 3-like [Ipomoea triloba]|uniref:protein DETOXIFICATION 3-like n=1 Tax=Ipomoea triloba TaxID=35885 RepID=UPI00125DE965|nr:protein DETOXIFICATION 3-like [Ipomoea triloba]